MKINKKISVALLSLTSFAASATIWDDLKELPATQYDVGRIMIEVGALEINKLSKGKDLEGTKYSINKVSSITKEKLGYTFALEARGKYINPADCSKFALHFKNNFINNGILNDLLPSLPEAQKAQLNQHFAVDVELINKDNQAVMTTCSAL